MAEAMVKSDNLVKIYKTKDIEVLALQGLDLTVEEGEFMAIIGNSGSGKSTFLNMIGGLDRPSAGKLFVDGKNLFTMTNKELVDYKRNTVGFVWQNNARNLVPYLSVLENIKMPMQFNNSKDKKEKALELLDMVGLSKKKDNKLYQLSGGEQQRIAIAIALSNSPKVLLADEPTGAVDRGTADVIFDVFRRLNRELGLTLIVVTHDVELSSKVERVAAIRDGKISSELLLHEAIDLEAEDTHLDGWGRKTHQKEYVVVDRAGRIQIPREVLIDMGLEGNKMVLDYKDGRITIDKP